MATATVVTPERFAQGLTITQFMEGMEENKDLFEESYRQCQLDPAAAAFLRGLGKHFNVLVLAEEWCGDVVRYVPALARMAEAAQTWDVRIFYRDQVPDLAGTWLRDGTQVIPVIVFFDDRMKEVGHFLERPEPVYTIEEEVPTLFAQENPRLPDASLPPERMSEWTRFMYTDFLRRYRNKHRPEWQKLFVDEVCEIVRNA